MSKVTKRKFVNPELIRARSFAYQSKGYKQRMNSPMALQLLPLEMNMTKLFVEEYI